LFDIAKFSSSPSLSCAKLVLFSINPSKKKTPKVSMNQKSAKNKPLKSKTFTIMRVLAKQPFDLISTPIIA